MRNVLIYFLSVILITACSPSTEDISERASSLDKRFALQLSLDGVLNQITEKNTDSSKRDQMIKATATMLPLAFEFLNEEINYINSIDETSSNKFLLDAYKGKVAKYFADHIQIGRLVILESYNQTQSDFGKLELLGSNRDELKQYFKNDLQKSQIDSAANMFNLMRFKKITSIAADGKESIIIIESKKDTDISEPVQM